MKIGKNDKQAEDNGEIGKSIFGVIALFFLELIKVVILAGITIVLVRHFLFKPFYVKGESMDPAYLEKDYLIINQFSYKLFRHQPNRGEVIVFRAPIQQKDFYLKRVIGLPGERVKVEEGKVIVYNEDHPQGIVIKEDYLVETTPGSASVTLGPDQYFVLGDNRNASYDSRRFGPINKDSIVGRTWIRGWPFNRLGLISVPSYDL